VTELICTLPGYVASWLLPLCVKYGVAKWAYSVLSRRNLGALGQNEVSLSIMKIMRHGKGTLPNEFRRSACGTGLRTCLCCALYGFCLSQ
jgi:hypothetical protein